MLINATVFKVIPIYINNKTEYVPTDRKVRIPEMLISQFYYLIARGSSDICYSSPAIVLHLQHFYYKQ